MRPLRTKLTKGARFFSALGCLFIGFGGSDAHAQISVDRVLVHLAAGQRPVHNVVVGNSSNDPAYVVVTVEEFPDPRDPARAVPSSDLLASPKSFSVEANGSRTVRLLLKAPHGEKERVFRVSFIPQDRGGGRQLEQTQGSRTTVIRVLTGMGLLVFADPLNPRTDLKWERTGDKIIFRNDGNVNVSLSDGESCAKPGDGVSPGQDCTKLDSKRVYGGSTFQVAAPSHTTVTYLKRQSVGGEFERLTIPPLGSK